MSHPRLNMLVLVKFLRVNWVCGDVCGYRAVGEARKDVWSWG